MNLLDRIDLITELGRYLQADTEDWKIAKQKAYLNNNWFLPQFIDLAVANIVKEFLQKDKLIDWVNHYHLDNNIQPKNTGIVMAGNIPLVGFHDFLCVFISGHFQTIKLSSKDEILLKHIVGKLYEWNPETKKNISFADMLKGYDAYIATGSNNSSRYFEYYFGKKSSIIRKNRTSVAILNGDENENTLELLADDVFNFFGLGCRNVTHIFVPEEYDFIPLLTSFKKYNYFINHAKYKNNYDYYLAIQLMNNQFYMTNNNVILIKDEQLFSPVSQLNYSFYKNRKSLEQTLKANENIQCIAGKDIPFGKTQQPSLFDYADGIDTIQFLLSL